MSIPPRFLPSLDALQVFEAAARLKSFKLAADELSVTAAAVSHRIRSLESALGCALFVREVRSVKLTAQGRQLQAAVSKGLQTIAKAVDDIRQPQRPTVRLALTPEVAAQWLLPKLADFQAAYPDIDLYVHTAYEVLDLNAGAADLAVRYGSGAWQGVSTAALFQECLAPVASADVQEKLSADPRQWPLIHVDWYLPKEQALQAALAGQGVAMLSLPLLSEELRQQRLNIVAGPYLHGAFYYLCTPNTRPLSAAVEAVKDWLLALAKQD